MVADYGEAHDAGSERAGGCTNDTAEGQTIDAAMCDSVASLASVFYAMQQAVSGPRSENPTYSTVRRPLRTYQTKDDKYVAVACLEPQFYATFIKGLGCQRRHTHPIRQGKLPKLTAILQQTLLAKTRDEWTQIFEGTDACVSAVNTLSEAASDPHYLSRNTDQMGHSKHPYGVPRYSRSDNAAPTLPPSLGKYTHSLLVELGYSPEEIDTFIHDGTVRKPN